MKQNHLRKGAARWLFRSARSSWCLICVLSFIYALISATTVAFALVLRNLIDCAVTGNFSGFTQHLWFTAATLLLQIVLRNCARRLDESAKSMLENTFKKRAYVSILSAAYEPFSLYHTGELQNRMTNDTVILADGMTSIVPNLIGMAVRLVAAMAVLARFDYRFTIIFFLCGCALFGTTIFFRRHMKRLHKAVQTADGVVRSHLQETVSNMVTVRAFGGEEFVEQMAENKMQAHRTIRMKRNLFSIICGFGFSFLMNGGYLFGLFWFGNGILHGTVTYGTLTAMLQLVGQVQQPFANLSTYLPKYYAMLASAERLMELEVLPRDAVERLLSREACRALYCRMRSILLSDVSFSYEGRDAVLSHVMERVQKGEFLAITGQSGIGKSTLLNLLLSVYSPNNGTISVELEDGTTVPISAVTRALFAYVPQGNCLMSGTIAQSVAFLDAEHPDMEKVKSCCKLACAEFIESLPQGYDTVLGESGAGLSEGQMQRLAIARALYTSAPILLLDESTSALDEETEERLLAKLHSQTDCTVLIVTHRPAALRICDRSIHLQKAHGGRAASDAQDVIQERAT